MEDALLGSPASPEAVMVFGTCEMTHTDFQTRSRQDLLDVLMHSGVKRLAAERILEIHCGVNAGPSRARSHATSRGVR